MCIPFGRPLKNVVELAQFRKLWIFVEANAARALTQPYAPSNLQISFVLYCARDLFNDSAPSTDFLLILRSVRVRAKKTTDDFFLSFFCSAAAKWKSSRSDAVYRLAYTPKTYSVCTCKFWSFRCRHFSLFSYSTLLCSRCTTKGKELMKKNQLLKQVETCFAIRSHTFTWEREKKWKKNKTHITNKSILVGWSSVRAQRSLSFAHSVDHFSI